MKYTLLIIFLSIQFSVSAQTAPPQKIGHADWEYIFSQLPEYKKIEVDLRAFETQLKNQLTVKAQEIETKYNAYTALPASTPDAIRKDKETELNFLQQNLEKFKQDAEASLQKKQAEFINPVFAKVGKAIEDVATENGYSYIINPQMMGGGDVLLFADDKYNISELVLKKLGVQPVKQPAGSK
jgi:outer membrane protein